MWIWIGLAVAAAAFFYAFMRGASELNKKQSFDALDPWDSCKDPDPWDIP